MILWHSGGAKLAVKYSDVLKMGSGGFGEVWSAKRETDGATVARKVLLAGDQDAVDRFKREVRILSSLDHPNVIRVIDKALSETPPYYIMPLYAHSLRSELPSIVGNSARIEAVLRAILDGVEYAHAQGVIHRDLKPENVLMNSDTDVVLSDFGLGRELDATSTRKTATGDTMGTPWYMAPEQLGAAKHADQRSDVYSLGRMLYELYTGPVMSAVQDTSLLPSGIRLLVTKCTQHAPERRFQTVTELKNTWLLLIDASAQESEVAELERLRAEVASATTVRGETIGRLFELLSRHADDSDLLHDTIMQLPADAVGVVARTSSETRAILVQFAEVTANRSYGFDYTDKIARVARALYENVDDAEVRAALIECVLRVGLRHNRWFVLGVFADLVSTKMARDEELAVTTRLGSIDEDERKYAANYVKVPLSPAIAKLFGRQ